MITDTRTRTLSIFSTVMASLALAAASPAVWAAEFCETERESSPFGALALILSVVLSHVMGAPAVTILVSGDPVAENCNAVPLQRVVEPVIIDWDPVTDQFFAQRGDVKFAVDLTSKVTGSTTVSRSSPKRLP